MMMELDFLDSWTWFEWRTIQRPRSGFDTSIESSLRRHYPHQVLRVTKGSFCFSGPAGTTPLHKTPFLTHVPENGKHHHRIYRAITANPFRASHASVFTDGITTLTAPRQITWCSAKRCPLVTNSEHNTHHKSPTRPWMTEGQEETAPDRTIPRQKQHPPAPEPGP